MDETVNDDPICPDELTYEQRISEALSRVFINSGVSMESLNLAACETDSAFNNVIDLWWKMTAFRRPEASVIKAESLRQRQSGQGRRAPSARRHRKALRGRP